MGEPTHPVPAFSPKYAHGSAVVSSFPCMQMRHMFLLLCKGRPHLRLLSQSYPLRPLKPTPFPVFPSPSTELFSESADSPPLCPSHAQVPCLRQSPDLALPTLLWSPSVHSSLQASEGLPDTASSPDPLVRSTLRPHRHPAAPALLGLHTSEVHGTPSDAVSDGNRAACFHSALQ